MENVTEMNREYEISINNIEEYIQELMRLYRIIKDVDNDENFESLFETNLLFRGVDNKEYSLQPSIARKSKKGATIFLRESNLINETRFKLPHIFENLDDPVDKVAMLQHLGIPTRMLDVTSNAIVALYFACSNNFEEDGAVYLLTVRNRYSSHNSLEKAVADISNTCCDSPNDFESFLTSVKQGVKNYNDQADLNWLQNLKDNIINNRDIEDNEIIPIEPWYVKAKAGNPRQLAQSGEYLLFSNDLKLIKTGSSYEITFNDSISPILASEGQCFAFLEMKKKIIIPKEYKKGILKQLSYIGITESSLFPDNSDIVCKSIRNRFF